MSQIPFMFKAGKPGRPGSVTVMIDNKPRVLTDASVNYNALIGALKEGAWSKVRALIDVRQAITQFTSGRVKIVGNELYVNDIPLHDALSSRIMEIFKTGMDIVPLVNFLNNIQENPDESAREELYLFLEACDLPITEDGHFLAYKYVNADYKDCHTGAFDNSVGAKPSMDRALCDTDRHRTCSTGLHFCSLDYLGDRRGSDIYHIMVVKVNPRDVTAVPSDYNNTKGRCCTYEVIEELLGEDTVLTPNFRNTDNSPIVSNDKVMSEAVKPSVEDRKANKVTGAATKLTEKDVKGIFKMLDEGFKYPVIGAKYGVHRRTVERIDKGESWTHVKR